MLFYLFNFIRIFLTKENVMVLERKSSGEVSFSEMFSYDQKVEIGNIDHIELRLVADSSSVEIFINEGEYALTSLIYPDQVCKNISIVTASGTIKVKDSYISVPTRVVK